MTNTEIKPLIGLGEIKFGWGRNQAKEALGEPTEIDAFAYDEDSKEELTEAWHYDEMELSCSFDEVEDWKLVNLSISAANFHIGGDVVIGSSKEELMDIINRHNLGEADYDEELNVVSVIESQMNFWLDEEGVSEVQWNVNWDEDENPVWPS